MIKDAAVEGDASKEIGGLLSAKGAAP